jgi:hypothetical protein
MGWLSICTNAPLVLMVRASPTSPEHASRTGSRRATLAERTLATRKLAFKASGAHARGGERKHGTAALAETADHDIRETPATIQDQTAQTLSCGRRSASSCQNWAAGRDRQSRT